MELQKQMKAKRRSYKFNVFLIALLFYNTVAFSTKESVTANLINLGAIAVFACIKALRRPKLLSMALNSRIFIWTVLFTLFLFVDIYTRNQYGEKATRYFPYVLGVSIFFLIILYDIDGPLEVILSFCKACLIAGLAIVAFTAITEREAILAGNIRLGNNLAYDVNYAGLALGVCSLGILFLYIKSKKRMLLIPYIIVVAFLLLTGSRSVFFSIAVNFAMYMMYGGLKPKKILAMLAALAALCLLIFTNDFFYELAGKRLLASLGELGILDNNLSDRSTSLRMQMVVYGLQLWAEKPIFGWGTKIMTSVSPWHTYAHNNYVELLANYGLFGFFLYYSIYIVLIWQALKLPKKSAVKCFLLALLFNSLLRDIGLVHYMIFFTYIQLIVAGVCLAKCRAVERSTSRQLASSEQDAARLQT